jgi:hypothetical protein
MTHNTEAPAFLHRDLMALARWVLGGAGQQTGEIVGSVRRCPNCAARAECVAHSKDLDLLAPMPAGGSDPLHARLAKYAREGSDGQPSLMVDASGAFLMPVKGFKPGFRAASLLVDVAAAERRPEWPHDAFSREFYDRHAASLVPVQIFRYDAGPQGNYGWIKLIRTGPNSTSDDFGRACLSRWKAVTSGGKSQDGYPEDATGRRYPVPDEQAAFRLLRMPYLSPYQRTAKAVPS